MKNINEIVKTTLKSYSHLRIVERNNRIVVCKLFLFRINIFKISAKKININSTWISGLLGRVFFKKDTELMQILTTKLIEDLNSNGVCVNNIIKNQC
jgi:hypothetical protein